MPSNQKIVKYRPNHYAGVIIFAVIFFYIIIAVFTYFTRSTIVPYEVKIGSYEVTLIALGSESYRFCKKPGSD
jgi:hypothetical protein